MGQVTQDRGFVVRGSRPLLWHIFAYEKPVTRSDCVMHFRVRSTAAQRGKLGFSKARGVFMLYFLSSVNRKILPLLDCQMEKGLSENSRVCVFKDM